MDNLDDKPAAYPALCCPLVNITHFTNSGPVIRVINNNLAMLPTAIGSIRLRHLHPDNIPVFIYRQRHALKDWAVDLVKARAKANGSNMAEHPKIQTSDFTMEFTVPTITALCKQLLNTPEAELGVLHHPDQLLPYRAKTYPDGSVDEYLIIHLHCNLINASQRLHVPEGGWNPPLDRPYKRADGNMDDRPAEKRARSGGPPDRGSLIRRDEIDNLRQDFLQSQELILKKLDDKEKAPPVHYPELPVTQGFPGGHTPWYVPDQDMPMPKFTE